MPEKICSTIHTLLSKIYFKTGSFVMHLIFKYKRQGNALQEIHILHFWQMRPPFRFIILGIWSNVFPCRKREFFVVFVRTKIILKCFSHVPSHGKRSWKYKSNRFRWYKGFGYAWLNFRLNIAYGFSDMRNLCKIEIKNGLL